MDKQFLSLVYVVSNALVLLGEHPTLFISTAIMVKVEGGIQVRYYQQGTVLPIFYVILAFALILTILDPDI